MGHENDPTSQLHNSQTTIVPSKKIHKTNEPIVKYIIPTHCHVRKGFNQMTSLV
jgi:hypothetical protein